MVVYYGVFGPVGEKKKKEAEARAASNNEESKDEESERDNDNTPVLNKVVQKIFSLLCVNVFHNLVLIQDGTEKKIHKSNKVYEHIKKELDLRSKKGYIKAIGYHGLFVDKSRNAAVSCGDRDLKSDVREKKLREK